MGENRPDPPPEGGEHSSSPVTGFEIFSLEPEVATEIGASFHEVSDEVFADPPDAPSPPQHSAGFDVATQEANDIINTLVGPDTGHKDVMLIRMRAGLDNYQYVLVLTNKRADGSETEATYYFKEENETFQRTIFHRESDVDAAIAWEQVDSDAEQAERDYETAASLLAIRLAASGVPPHLAQRKVQLNQSKDAVRASEEQARQLSQRRWRQTRDDQTAVDLSLSSAEEAEEAKRTTMDATLANFAQQKIANQEYETALDKYLAAVLEHAQQSHQDELIQAARFALRLRAELKGKRAAKEALEDHQMLNAPSETPGEHVTDVNEEIEKLTKILYGLTNPERHLL